MSKLLHIKASPRKERSHSAAVADGFIKAYGKAYPDDTVEVLDLWQTELPEMCNDTVNAKYRILHGEAHTDAEAAAWQSVVSVFESFAKADKYVLSVPMWNFGIPYKLKHFIDVVTQPTLAFNFTPEGYQGLVKGKPVLAICSRGGDYNDEDLEPLDFQLNYLETWLEFIGFVDIRTIVVAPTIGDPDAVKSIRAEAVAHAIETLKSF